MKKLLPLFILGSALVFVLLCSTKVLASQNTEVFNFPASIPVFDTNFSDLDARDTNNNPITDNRTENELRAIFISGLYSLLLTTEIYSFAKACEQLRKKLKLDAFSFASALPQAAYSVVAAILREFKKSLSKMPLSLSFAFLVSLICFFLIDSKTLFGRYCSGTAPLPLRC